MNNTRSIRIDLSTPVEKQIRDCIDAIEKMPADVRLTNAQVKLREGLGYLSNYIDEQINKAISISKDDGLLNIYKNYCAVLKNKIPNNLSGENLRLFKYWEDKINSF